MLSYNLYQFDKEIGHKTNYIFNISLFVKNFFSYVQFVSAGSMWRLDVGRGLHVRFLFVITQFPIHQIAKRVIRNCQKLVMINWHVLVHMYALTSSRCMLCWHSDLHPVDKRSMIPSCNSGKTISQCRPLKVRPCKQTLVFDKPNRLRYDWCGGEVLGGKS